MSVGTAHIKRTSTGPTCGATTKTAEKKGRPCRKQAGWGTDHLGYGLCRLHGGLLPVHRERAAMMAVREEMARGMGAPVIVRRLELATLRAVVLAVVNAIEPSVDQQFRAREVLETEIAALHTVSYEQAKRIEAAHNAKPKKRRESDEPTAAEIDALDQLVHPSLTRSTRKSNRKEDSK